MNTDQRIQINLENARHVANNNYSNLSCPKCGENQAEAFFTKDSQNVRYGLWFECLYCKNVEHISCSKMPDGYDASRLSDKFQKLDESAWSSE